MRFGRVFAVALTCLVPLAARADITVAVAANFLTPAREIVELFEAQGGEKVRLVHGATGLLYAQITHGAPFEVFLAADQERPALLEAEGRVEARQTYAEGILIMVSREMPPASAEDYAAFLQARRIALANPRLAPYGAAAMAGLTALGLGESDLHLVMGDNVGQAAGIMVSGNADIGLLAASQLFDLHRIDGSLATVPFPTEVQILQDMVLLTGASPGAVEFFDFMSSDVAREVIGRMGYRVP